MKRIYIIILVIAILLLILRLYMLSSVTEHMCEQCGALTPNICTMCPTCGLCQTSNNNLECTE